MNEEGGLAIVKILKSLKEKGAANAGDIVNSTGLPRYYVLAAFQILHELGYIELIYSKGSHKVYRITDLGKDFLERGNLPEIHEGEKAEA